VAELGSAFLCGEMGLQGNLQHASYIDSWLKILQEDSRAIFRAASLASKAHKFINAFSEAVSDLQVA
ncbi:MAG: zincin-like metallopeptidase domain-containing protein, partial [Gammaproteobacteria bacterium]